MFETTKWDLPRCSPQQAFQNLQEKLQDAFDSTCPMFDANKRKANKHRDKENSGTKGILKLGQTKTKLHPIFKRYPFQTNHESFSIYE
jgi:hypothetical protein